MTAKSFVVPVEGIEPPLLAEHDFESCASTSSATRAAPASISSQRKLVYRVRPLTAPFQGLALMGRTGKLPQSAGIESGHGYRDGSEMTSTVWRQNWVERGRAEPAAAAAIAIFVISAATLAGAWFF